MENEMISSHTLVQNQLQDVILQQQETIDSLKQSIDEKESSVPLWQYEEVLRKLEDEQIAHAATASKLMDCQDKLDFALGEIEMLKKQIEREKKQFESTFGMLKTKALKDTVKTVELENKCHVIKSQCKEQEGNIVTKDQQIQKLSEKLKSTTDEYNQQLSELNIKMQQEMYIAKMMEDADKKSSKGIRTKRHGKGGV